MNPTSALTAPEVLPLLPVGGLEGPLREPWVQQFALLIASGISVSLCAQRLDKSERTLSKLFDNHDFQQMVHGLVQEQGATGQGALKMLSGGAVDSVLCMLKLRADPGTPPKLKFEICKYMLDRVYGTPKGGYGDQSHNETQSMLEKAKREGKTMADVLMSEISELCQANPALMPALMPALQMSPNGAKSSTPELGSRGLAELQGPARMV